MWGKKVHQSFLGFSLLLGLVAISQAAIDDFEPETEQTVTEGGTIDLMCRTDAEKFSYCTFTDPSGRLWVKFKYDDDEDTVQEAGRKWLNVDYIGDSKECKITVKDLRAGDNGESGTWTCKVEDWETEYQEEGMYYILYNELKCGEKVHFGRTIMH